MIEIFKYAYQNLLRKRTQVSLTVCGIAIGVYSVLLIASIGMTGQKIIGRELERMGFDCITISATDKTLNRLDSCTLGKIRDMEEVALASPLTTALGQASMREYIGDVLVCGIDRDAGGIIELVLKNGRFLRGNDISARARVCLVDDKLARAYYKRDNIVGKKMTLNVDGTVCELKIVGVVSSEHNTFKNLAGDYIPAFIYLPYTTLQSFLGKEAVDQVFVRLQSDKDSKEVGEAISERLSADAGYSNLYRFDDLTTQKDRINTIIQSVTVVLAAIGGVSLVVSGLSIMTIMLVSIRDRTREIGIKKAIGAREKDILAEFLAESLLLSFLGSLGGAGACVITAWAAQLATGLAIVLDVPLFTNIIFFATGVGVVFGVYPARLAARLHPVDALRRE